MKKSLLTFIAASALCLGASAQTQYIMQVTKTNGQVEMINADEVESISFVEGTLSPKVAMMTEVRNSLYGLASRKMNFAALNMGTEILSEFVKVLLPIKDDVATLIQQAYGSVMKQVKPVEEGSELAKAGYQKYIVLDYRMFDGIYTNTDKGITKDEALGKVEINFPVDMEGYKGSVSASITGSGNTTDMLVTYAKDKTVALIIRLPETLNLAISNQEGAKMFEGKMSFAFEKKSEGSSYIIPLQDKWTVSTEMKANLKEANDENTISSSLGYDGSTGTITSDNGFEMNGQKVIERRSQVTLPVLTQLAQIIPMIGNMSGLNNGSIIDVIGNMLSSGNAKNILNGISYMALNGATIDNYEVTLLGDLTMAVNVNNIYAASQAIEAMKEARRNGADEATISQHAETLNQLVQLKVKTNKLGAELPAKMVAAQVGVDWTVMPAISFDGQEYTPVPELIDVKSTCYIVNIADHCIKPLSSVASSMGIITGNLIKLFTMQEEAVVPAE